MSNGRAIEAVTVTLMRLLERLPKELPDGGGDDDAFDTVKVTAKPLDKANQDPQADRLNLFLYQATPNAAWRNMDVPRQTHPGETGLPPLPLDLHYLLSAFTDSADEIKSHGLLGRAMRALHDHPVLGREEIERALKDANLHNQVERVRITPLPLSLDELSKLWAGFQTQFRLSAAYLISVVLIESRRTPASPLPVLKRGKDDRGVAAVASPAPTLDDAVVTAPFMNARMGDIVTLVGSNLRGDAIKVRIVNTRLGTVVERQPNPGGTERELTIAIGDASETPDARAEWTAGFHTATVIVTTDVATGAAAPSPLSWATNERSFGIAPRVAITAPAIAAGETSPKATAGDVDITLTCTPRLRDRQEASLVMSGLLAEPGATSGAFYARVSPTNRETPADVREPTSLTFTVRGLAKGTYTVRLRVDGVDSIPLPAPRPNGTQPMEFDPAQQVIVE